jgi:hypothetical protein
MGEIMRRRSTYETGTGIHGCEHLSTLLFEFLLEALSPVTNRMGGVTSSRSGTGQKVGFRPTLEKCLEKLVCDNHGQTSACAGCPRIHRGLWDTLAYRFSRGTLSGPWDAVLKPAFV